MKLFLFANKKYQECYFFSLTRTSGCLFYVL